MFGLTPYRKNSDMIGKNNTWLFQNLFDEFLNDSFLPDFVSGSNYFKADLKETDKEYILSADLPGLKKEDIVVTLKNDVLTVSANKIEEENEKTENYIRKERKYGSFSRSFYVANISNDNINAKYENGVLTVVLPKNTDSKENNYRININ